MLCLWTEGNREENNDDLYASFIFRISLNISHMFDSFGVLACRQVADRGRAV